MNFLPILTPVQVPIFVLRPSKALLSVHNRLLHLLTPAKSHKPLLVWEDRNCAKAEIRGRHPSKLEKRNYCPRTVVNRKVDGPDVYGVLE